MDLSPFPHSEQPGIVGRDLRPAQQHFQFRPLLLQPLGNPQRALDVPEIAGEAHHPRPARENFLDQPLIAEDVAERGRQQLDVVRLFEALAAGIELQTGGRQGHVAFHRPRPGRRNRQLHQQHQTTMSHGTRDAGRNDQYRMMNYDYCEDRRKKGGQAPSPESVSEGSAE